MSKLPLMIPPLIRFVSLCVQSLQQFVCQAPEGAWQHNMSENVTGVVPAPFRPQGIETGSKLYISNLDCGVSSDDIKVNNCSS